jgi:hypothetical protein
MAAKKRKPKRQQLLCSKCGESQKDEDEDKDWADMRAEDFIAERCEHGKKTRNRCVKCIAMTFRDLYYSNV